MDSQYERLSQPPQQSQSAQSQSQPPAQPPSYTQMHMHMQAPSHQHHLYAHDPYLQTQPSAPMYPQTYFAPSAYGLHPSYSSSDVASATQTSHHLSIPPISSLPASITLQSLQHIMDVPYSLLPLHPQSPPTRSARDHSLPFHSPLTSFAHQDPLPTDDEDDEAPRPPPPLRTAAKSGAPPTTVGDAAEERRSQGGPPHRSQTTAMNDAASDAWTSPPPQPRDSPPTPTQHQAAATAAAATTGADAHAVLPVPAQFEEVNVQHRLDVRWEFVFYKSTGYCANRRRYLARCKYCDYEIEGRPERLERHALVHCKRLPDAVRATYRDAVQRMGKLTVPEDEVSAVCR